jgi:uncharacterized membrane protein YidH (DUF202 family)
MKRASIFTAYWWLGTAIASAGVALTRWVAPTLERNLQASATLSGQLFALLGLFVIALGISRRLRGLGQAEDPPSLP